MPQRLLAILFGLLAFVTPAAAQFEAFKPPSEEPPARVRLASEHRALRPGEVNHIALIFEIDDGWHIYWDGLNVTGFAPDVRWDLPEGFKAAPIRWPGPKRHVSPGDILDHVYEGVAVLIVPMHVPSNIEPGAMVTIRASLEWLVCRELCMAGDAQVELSLPVGVSGGAVGASPDAKLIRTSIRSLPAPWPPAGVADVELSWEDAGFRVRCKPGVPVAFYPDATVRNLVDLIEDGASRSGDLLLRVGGERPRRVSGILEIGDKTLGKTALYTVSSEEPDQGPSD